MSQDIAENLRRVMAERGIDANTLASELGYRNRATVDHWLSRRRLPTPENIKRAAEVLGVPAEAIDPSGSAYNLTGPRKKSHGVDNNVGVGRIPSSQPQLPTTTEGLMRDQFDRLKGALLQLPQEHRERFTRQVSVLAARLLLELEEPGVLPGKEKRAAGKG